MTALTSIRNIGPAFETELQRAGIDTAEELREIGAHDAYARMVEAGAKPHFIGYYVLHMALQGRPWNDCKGAEKDQLRIAFDNLKSEKTDPARSEIEAFMNRIGVISSPS
jgi:hypothetical protein